MNILKIRSKLKEQNGMALVAVVLVFVVIMILTSTAVAMVYGDTKFSHDDEKGKQAYYAARSAVEAVEKGMLDELGAVQDAKGAIMNDMAIEVNALNADFEAGLIPTEEEYDLALDAIIASYAGDINDYEALYGDFMDYILPSSGSYTHFVTIDGFDTDSTEFEVVVTPIPNTDPDDDYIIDAFKLTATASMDGKESKAVKWVGIRVEPGDTITLQTLDQDIEIVSNLFDNAIYSYGDLTFGEGGGASSAEVIGGIVYEGELENGDNVSTVPFHKTPPTAAADIVEPSSLLPVAVSDLQERTTNLESVLTAEDDNGYYKQAVKWSGTYTVNTSDATGGDVVLMFNSVTVDKKNGYQFNVTGGNNLYIYIYDQKADGVDFTLTTNSNNETPFTISSSSSHIYFIIDQPLDQREVETNDMEFDLGKNKITMDNVYIYAPFTCLSFKNSFDYTGSIVVGGLEIKNNAVVTYKEPDNNPEGPGEEIFVGEEISIPVSGTDTLTYSGGSYWLKKW